jgi:lysophospholipase L1-like esterase
MKGRADIAWLVVAWMGAGAFAQDYMDVPRVHTRSPGVFSGLFERARCETVSAVLLGDSQESCPGGAGAVYVPRLQHEFWSRYGRGPQTPLAPMNASYGGWPIPGDWLLRVANTAEGVRASTLPGAWFPPGMTACVTSAAQGSNVNQDQWYPQIVMLQPDSADVHTGAAVAGGERYFLGGEVYVEVLAARMPGSGEVRVDISTAPTNVTNFFRPVERTFETSLGLDGPGPSPVWARLGPIAVPEGGYLQAGISGTDPTRLTHVLGARFVDAQSGRGWAITSFSQGGHKTSDLLSQHGGCGPVLGAMRPDVLILAYGANDSGVGYTAAWYRAGLEAIIAYARQHTRADLPVIVLQDPNRRGLTTPQQIEFERYPRAAMELAEADPLVCAVNSRRLTHEQGWEPSFSYRYLADLVHYNPGGAVLKAEVEAGALFDAFLASPACKMRARDVPCGTSDPCAFRGGVLPAGPPDLRLDPCDGDMNGDGNVDQDDVALLVDAVAGADVPIARPADVNGDGNVDQDDVAWLINLVAGAPCPG